MTRGAALAAAGYLAIEMWKVQWAWGFFLNWAGAADRGQGIEFSVMLDRRAGLPGVRGTAGDWSIDGRRANSAASRAAGRARVRRKRKARTSDFKRVQTKLRTRCVGFGLASYAEPSLGSGLDPVRKFEVRSLKFEVGERSQK